MRKCTLKTFSLIHGYDFDDFVKARRTVRIYYTLKGQTKRRAYHMNVPEVYFDDLKTLRRLIWFGFKKELNIVG
jgi:hypothetical protein